MPKATQSKLPSLPEPSSDPVVRPAFLAFPGSNSDPQSNPPHLQKVISQTTEAVRLWTPTQCGIIGAGAYPSFGFHDPIPMIGTTQNLGEQIRQELLTQKGLNPRYHCLLEWSIRQSPFVAHLDWARVICRHAAIVLLHKASSALVIAEEAEKLADVLAKPRELEKQMQLKPEVTTIDPPSEEAFIKTPKPAAEKPVIIKKSKAQTAKEEASP